ncbi:MAG: GTPase ObgE [Thermodesulfobacteriota bacterium]
MSQFIDEAIITVISGRGGDGCVSFRREKFVPLGGPNGGDGGKGGDIIFVANENLTSLLDFRYRKIYKADKGENGKGKNQHGKNGEDLIIPLPVGTIIKNTESSEIIGDLTENNQQIVVARGGKGGKGNARFVSSTNRAPRRVESGRDGEEQNIILELKLLADVGIMGFPNAGKSTLISKISAARPKIADYPFTTLVPNLGVVNFSDEKTFVVADIPGIIEGAHEGAGLGFKFLKHIERTKILVHLIDISPADKREPLDDYKIMNNELSTFSSDLASKPQIVVLNKMDVIDSKDILTNIENSFKDLGVDILSISAITGEGINDLLNTVVKKLEETQ